MTRVSRCYNIDCRYNDKKPPFPKCTLDEISLGRNGKCELGEVNSDGG